jgi:dienelactone hydrolase
MEPQDSALRNVTALTPFRLASRILQASMYANITAAFEYLTRKLGVSPSKLVLYGQSIGSAPTVRTRTYALQAPYASCSHAPSFAAV